MEERLQKILSGAGICSRRKAEEYLTAGRVKVNGITASLGDKADPERDVVEVDGTAVTSPAAHTYIMLYKPRGVVTTMSDEKGRPTVAELVRDCPARVWPVGRLDMDSEGLLLLTDDGELTHRLTHPSHRVEKEYVVKVRGDAAQALSLLRAPMVIDGEDMETDRVELTGKNTLTMVIHQGKNRQIRRMCAAAGLEVLRLKRVREGGLRLHDLQAGCWKLLTNEEIFLLKL
mgnify:FL=1